MKKRCTLEMDQVWRVAYLLKWREELVGLRVEMCCLVWRVVGFHQVLRVGILWMKMLDCAQERGRRERYINLELELGLGLSNVIGQFIRKIANAYSAFVWEVITAKNGVCFTTQ